MFLSLTIRKINAKSKEASREGKNKIKKVPASSKMEKKRVKK